MWALSNYLLLPNYFLASTQIPTSFSQIDFWSVIQKSFISKLSFRLVLQLFIHFILVVSTILEMNSCFNCCWKLLLSPARPLNSSGESTSTSLHAISCTKARENKKFYSPSHTLCEGFMWMLFSEQRYNWSSHFQPPPKSHFAKIYSPSLALV